MRIILFLILQFLILASANAQLSDDERFCIDSPVGPDAGIDACARVINLASTRNEVLVLAFASRATAWFARNDYDKAIADATEALRRNPQIQPALFIRANAWQAKRNHDQAIADFSEVLRLNPQDSNSYFGRGASFGSKGESDRAIADYSEAIRLNPQYANAYYARGLAWTKKMEYDRALADYTQTVTLSPKSAPAFEARGTTWLLKGDQERAIADYSQAIGLNPKAASAYRNRGSSRFFMGKYPLAQEDFATAMTLVPLPYAVIWKYLAGARAGKTDREALRRDIGGLTVTGWPEPVIRFYLGELGSYQLMSQAGASPDQAVRLGQACEANFFVGEDLLTAGRVSEAKAYFQVARGVCPKDYIEYTGAVTELNRLP